MNEKESKKCFPPVIEQGAMLLILGSLPGDESLRQCRYYAHKRNAFWPIMGQLLGFDHTLPYEQRLDSLCKHHIALWDVLASGIRPGSLDTSITAPQANDLPGLLARYPTIKTICCNGGASYRYLKKYCPYLFGSHITIKQLPSSSPAAARLSLQDKLAVYREIILPALGI